MVFPAAGSSIRWTSEVDLPRAETVLGVAAVTAEAAAGAVAAGAVAAGAVVTVTVTVAAVVAMVMARVATTDGVAATRRCR